MAYPAEFSPNSTRSEAFEVVYREEHLKLVRLAHLIIGSNGEAEELVHDVFVAAYKRWDRIDDKPGYLYRAVVNRSRSALRRIRLERRHAPVIDKVAFPPEVDEVWEALAMVPVRRRTVLVLRYYLGFSVDEIASVMGSRPATVRSLIHRGHQSLRKVMDVD